jgi:uncharacterized protein YxeA
MRVVILLITALFLTVTTSAYCVEPVNTTDRNNPFVKLLEAQYLKYYEAGNDGDLEAWLKTRDAKTANQIKNTPGVNSAMSKQFSKGNTDLREFEFVSVETEGNVARIIHKKVTEDSIILEGAMFYNEDGEWKMGDGSQHTFSGDLAKDIDSAFKDFIANPKLQLLKN